MPNDHYCRSLGECITQVPTLPPLVPALRWCHPLQCGTEVEVVEVELALLRMGALHLSK